MTSIKDKRIFITGGAGFIGSTLASRLYDSNDVVLFDNLSRNTIQHTEIANHPRIRLMQGDILDFRSVSNAMRGADIVVHAAAIAGASSDRRSLSTTSSPNVATASAS